jgi:hypothetical protein
MKTIKFTGMALLLLTLLNAQGEPPRTDINPALIYYQAFLLDAKPLSDADRNYLESKAGREQKLPERFGPLLAGYDDRFKLLREAAKQKAPCDWGIDMNGPGTFLPHLRFIKAAAVASQPRAVWDLQHGNQAGARDDLLAAFVLGRTASQDGTVIGALVRYACHSIVYTAVARNFGQFSPETLQQLADESDAVPVQGTMAAAIMTEKSIHVNWLLNKIRKIQQANPGDDAMVLAAIPKDEELGVLGEYDNEGKQQKNDFWQGAFTAAGGTSDGVIKLIQESEPLYLRVVEIMNLPLPEYNDQVQKFAEEIQKSQNPFVKLLFVDPTKPRVKEFRVQAWQAMVRAAVEYKLHGKTGLKSVTDPLGNGPFTFQRFVFEGVDRGFELKSAYAGLPYPCALIFVEKEGPAFNTDGPHIGEAVKP